jgi:glycosyltransferase involved in cell wall biosynthesis
METARSSATAPVRLSVVICTKDRPQELATCLGSIATQRLAPMEVVIVDSSATAPEAVVAEFRRRVGYPVELIRAEPGLPHQRNVGIDAAKGDVVVFLDDDVVLEDEYLEEIARVYEADASRAIGGVGGAQVPDPTPRESPAMRAFRRFFLLSCHGRGRVKLSGRAEYLLSPTQPVDVEFLSGCNMSYRREVFGAGLRFDERLRGYALGEDLQFSYRVSRRWRLRLTPAARVDHRHTGGGRPESAKFREMAVFNVFLFFRDDVVTHPLQWLAYFWSCIGDLILRLTAPRRHSIRGLINGYGRVLRHLRSSSDQLVPADSAGVR